MVLHQPLHCLHSHQYFSLRHRILELELMLSNSAVCVMSVVAVHVVEWFNGIHLHCLQFQERLQSLLTIYFVLVVLDLVVTHMSALFSA